MTREQPRILVVGGVAAGMSAASQARRRNPKAHVCVLERGPDVAYGSCGIPYNIEDPKTSMNDLVKIPLERLRDERGIDVRTGHKAIAIDPSARLVEVREERTGRRYREAYDRLVIATGARAIRPPIEGLELPGVFFLRELTDGKAIKRFCAERRPRQAVILGAGYIGMEMAEVLKTRGVAVTILEREAQVLPGFEPEIIARVNEELHQQGTEVHTGTTGQAVRATGQGVGLPLRVETDRGSVEADLLLVSVGVRPNSEIAQTAGIHLGGSGAIATDDRMCTNIEGVFAAGDCAEAWHRVLRAPVWIPLGTTANKQGKVAGANAAGADQRFSGIVGTAGFKVFDLEVARTGLGAAEIERAGVQALRVPSRHLDRSMHYPGSAPVDTVLFVERDTRRLVGAQMVGRTGIAKRIDVLATALYANMSIDDIEALDLSYAPPFAPVYDPILIAAAAARKALASAAGKGRPDASTTSEPPSDGPALT